MSAAASGQDERCTSYRFDSQLFSPLVIEPDQAGASLVDWADGRRAHLEHLLLEHGALLFRGFDAGRREGFARVAGGLSAPLDYLYRSTPRTGLGARMYTATEFPPHYSIPVHCENAYQAQFPAKLFFYCEQPASQGGATPLADVRAVTQQLDPAVLRRFADRQVMYVRNYGAGVDLGWEEVFQTADRNQAEQYCRRYGIATEWLPGGLLRTRQVLPALARHPGTGETLWFNQAHLFHVSGLPKETREALLSIFSLEELPRNAFYGDGSPIELDVLAHVRATFDACTAEFPWQRDDVLMLDNMAVAHGRQPYAGARSVLVMMGDLVQRTEYKDIGK